MRHTATCAYIALLTALPTAGSAANCVAGRDSSGTACAAEPSVATQGQFSYRAVGTVKRIDVTTRTVTVAHEEIKALNWPAMTMVFRVADARLLETLVINRRYEFAFVRDGNQFLIVEFR